MPELRPTIIRALRGLGLLRGADLCRFGVRRLTASRNNRTFLRDHPGFCAPPPQLAFDALNHCDWSKYWESGLRHARTFARIILQHTDAMSLDVLEWGCGPGRLLRHMAGLLAARDVRLTGSDYNPETIAWCRQNLAGIDFVQNDLMPPLPLSDKRFDVVFNFSVLTHLSEAAQVAWIAELRRVLKPGGLLICTTHGDHYRRLLASATEREQYERGEVVTQGRYAEGKKWYFAVHPPQFVRGSLLREFDDPRRVPTAPEDRVFQDVWIAFKPDAADTNADRAQSHAVDTLVSSPSGST